ncbi:MAG: hypothetical protein ACYCT1_12205 [Steroidobacteraceae bacterium]
MSTLRQQVNLYQPEAKARQGLFSAQSLVLICAVALVALGLVWGIGAWQVQQLAHSVARLERQQQLTERALSALGTVSAANTSPGTLAARIHTLEAELAARREALALLKQGAIGSTRGFSAELTALARGPVPGLWLRRISLSAVGDPMSLAGEALEPDMVPRYLRALARQPALAGVRFDRLVIEMKSAAPALAARRPYSALRRFRFQVAGQAPSAQQPAQEAPQT